MKKGREQGRAPTRATPAQDSTSCIMCIALRKILRLDDESRRRVGVQEEVAVNCVIDSEVGGWESKVGQAQIRTSGEM